MVKIVVSTFISNGSLWLYLDHELIAKNSDSISVEVPEDKGYILHWFVSGNQGSSFSITISSPKDAQFQLTRALTHTGKDHGGFNFET
jgi:hypothetical protein